MNQLDLQNRLMNKTIPFVLAANLPINTSLQVL